MSADQALLILIPTAVELDPVRAWLAQRELPVAFGEVRGGCRLEQCGFGPIAAAAATTRLLYQCRPTRVVLLGIAGTYCESRLPVASAASFTHVGCYGIGVGDGEEHHSAASLGWSQWVASEHSATSPRCVMGDHLRIDVSAGSDGCSGSVLFQRETRWLLTCCAASGGPADVARRTAAFPAALAEDMEGFGVAMACAIAAVPLQIIRGISNRAGDRHHREWQIEAAMIAAAEQLEQFLETPAPSKRPSRRGGE